MESCRARSGVDRVEGADSPRESLRAQVSAEYSVDYPRLIIHPLDTRKFQLVMTEALRCDSPTGWAPGIISKSGDVGRVGLSLANLPTRNLTALPPSGEDLPPELAEPSISRPHGADHPRLPRAEATKANCMMTCVCTINIV